MSRIIFVTGTDTGVGKTLLTASLVHFLRQSGIKALAMKPFCSGGTGDVELIQQIQKAERPTNEINPFCFSEPVAPLVAARRERRRIGLKAVLAAVQSLAEKTDCLIVEGAGGLLTPLGERFTLGDVVAKLGSEIIIVGPNKLGVINGVLLSVEALRARGIAQIKIVLMEQKARDTSAQSNVEILREWLAPMEIFSLPYLGPQAVRLQAVKKNVKKIKITLARLLESANVSLRSLDRCRKRRPQAK